MSTIQFLCPQGHPLEADASHAGAEAECPTCGTRMLVPSPTPPIPPAPAPKPKAGGAGTLFFFYCPQGHRLNGPTTLQGRPGKCPHCGSRFVIPSPHDDSSHADLPPTIVGEFSASDDHATDKGANPPDAPALPSTVPTPAGSPPAAENRPPGLVGKPVPTVEAGPDEIRLGEIIDKIPSTDFGHLANIPNGFRAANSPSSFVSPTIGPPATDPPTDTPSHETQASVGPLATMASGPAFAELPSPGTSWQQFFVWAWERRGPGESIEILLRDGDRIRPTWFAPHLSASSFGVFAVDDGSGLYTMIAVRWTEMRRLFIRSIPTLPRGFE